MSDGGGGVTSVDASLSNDGAPASGNGANPFATTSGCACVSAPGQRSPAPVALVASLVLVCLRRRPRRARVVRVSRIVARCHRRPGCRH
jgi:hypothetical protein